MDTDKIVFGVIGTITLAVLAFIFISSSSVSSKQASPTDIVGSDPHYKGVSPDKAQLTVVEFSDFECPFCAQYPPLLSELVSKYPDRLSVVYRHFPLRNHVGSLPAAKASEAAAKQGKFWEYHDELFLNQPEFSSDNLKKYAETTGLNVETFTSDMNSEDVVNKVAEDSDMANNLRLTGTPSFSLIYDGKAEKLNLKNFGDLEAKVDEILDSPAN